MASVVFEGATRTYPGTVAPAVDHLDLTVADGEFLVLVGPSGCGKTTSLRMIAGLERVDEGRIRLGERDVTQLKAKERNVAMVFQNYALYPHMTVADNMGFPLRMIGVPKAEIAARVRTAAEMLGLEPYLARKPKALSGGQRQRVAMGRAVVREPEAFLMDEPLSNLDAQLRVQTRTQIHALQRRLGVTTVYVTHDQTEAMTMGDRVAVLDGGVLQQLGKPGDLYERPANVFVAGFIGSPSMNLLEVALTADGIDLLGTALVLERRVLDAGLDRVIVGLRPEDLGLGPADRGLRLEVSRVELLGSDVYVYGTAEGAELAVRVDADRAPREGEAVGVSLRRERLHLFSPATGERLN